MIWNMHTVHPGTASQNMSMVLGAYRGDRVMHTIGPVEQIIIGYHEIKDRLGARGDEASVIVKRGRMVQVVDSVRVEDLISVEGQGPVEFVRRGTME